MSWLRILAMAAVVGFTLAAPAQARIQKQMFCWEPDSEFPVGCDDDDDDDDPDPGLAATRRSAATVNRPKGSEPSAKTIMADELR